MQTFFPFGMMLIADTTNCLASPNQNIEKMSQGHPLTDEDRWGWLQRISQVSLETVSIPTSPPDELGDTASNPPGCITTCSALKKSYRDLLRGQLSEPGLAILRFLFLTASEEVLLQRIEERENHYMKKNMVHSQIVTAEVPRTGGGEDGSNDGGDEREIENDCKVIWTDDMTPDEVVEMAVEVVKQIMIADVSEPQSLKSEGGENIDEEEKEEEQGEEQGEEKEEEEEEEE
ncbi:hypothetical protein AA313_de0207081 [Arthrobotrys entomopaga]|nr:hypothetical protein AA313_de0207081 [Arthrobotrys entomopaga]